MINGVRSFWSFFDILQGAGAVVINDTPANASDISALLFDLIFLRNNIRAYTIKHKAVYIVTY